MKHRIFKHEFFALLPDAVFVLGEGDTFNSPLAATHGRGGARLGHRRGNDPAPDSALGRLVLPHGSGAALARKPTTVSCLL